MARTANVFARVEPELKEQAESVFRSGQFYFDACLQLVQDRIPEKC
ncbi:MAG: hypothetical protein ACLVCH_10190 [Roseburia inulinivorans]